MSSVCPSCGGAVVHAGDGLIVPADTSVQARVFNERDCLRLEVARLRLELRAYAVLEGAHDGIASAVGLDARLVLEGAL